MKNTTKTIFILFVILGSAGISNAMKSTAKNEKRVTTLKEIDLLIEECKQLNQELSELDKFSGKTGHKLVNLCQEIGKARRQRQENHNWWV